MSKHEKNSIILKTFNKNIISEILIS
jgi:hypothetical protein